MTIVFLLSSEASLFPLFSSQPQKETLRFHAQRKLKKKKKKESGSLYASNLPTLSFLCRRD